MKYEDVPFEMAVISNSLERTASKIETLLLIIFLLVLLSIGTRIGNAIESAKTTFTLYFLRDTYVGRLREFEGKLEEYAKHENFGRLDFQIQTGKGQIIYDIGRNYTDTLQILFVKVISDERLYGGNVLSVVEIYPEDETLRQKAQSQVAESITPEFRASVQDVARQIMQADEYQIPNVQLFYTTLSESLFPVTIFFFAFFCVQLLNTFKLDLKELYRERKRAIEQGENESEIRRLFLLLIPEIIIQNLHHYWWYPFSSWAVGLLILVYFISIVLNLPSVNLQLVEPDLSIMFSFENVPASLVNGALIIASVLMLKSSLQDLKFIKQ